MNLTKRRETLTKARADRIWSRLKKIAIERAMGI
jgi:hypothetical protein